MPITNNEFIWQYLEQGAQSDPERTLWSYQGRDYSYQEINELSNKLATGLLGHGYCKGDCLGLIALNQPEWLISYFAALKIGVVLVGLSVRYRDEELKYILEQSGARGVICLAQYDDLNYREYLSKLKENLSSLEHIFYIDEASQGSGKPKPDSFDKLISNTSNSAALNSAKEKISGEHPSIIIYTSGTTGRPKGAVLTHASQLAAAVAQAEHLKMNEKDVVPLTPPLNHVGGLTCAALAALVAGSSCLMLPQFSPKGLINLLKEKPITIMGGVPTMYSLLMQEEEFTKLDHSQVRILQIGGANADPELLMQLQKHYPNAVLLNNYGMSETSGFVLMGQMNDSQEMVLQSVGKTIGDCKVKVVDAENNTLPAGNVGELCIQGSSVIKAYHDMPEKSAQAIDDEGWLASGDLAELTKSGHVILRGRQKEMYLQGGFNVYPVEVENLMMRHSEVLLAAGIGVPDKILGEVGRYFIVLSPTGTATEHSLKEYCREHLANYKIPREIVFLKELPMTSSGKVNKSVLKTL